MTRFTAIVLSIVGAAGLVLAYQRDIGVDVPSAFSPFDTAGRVVNLSLVARQQNALLISGVIFLAGIILFASSGKSALDHKIESTLYARIRPLLDAWSETPVTERWKLLLTVAILVLLLTTVTNVFVSLVLGSTLAFLCVKKDCKRETESEVSRQRYRVAVIAVLASQLIGFFFAAPMFVIAPFWLLSAWQIYVHRCNFDPANATSLRVRTLNAILVYSFAGFGLLYVVSNYFTVKHVGSLSVEIVGPTTEEGIILLVQMILIALSAVWLSAILIQVVVRKVHQSVSQMMIRIRQWRQLRESNVSQSDFFKKDNEALAVPWQSEADTFEGEPQRTTDGIAFFMLILLLIGGSTLFVIFHRG